MVAKTENSSEAETTGSSCKYRPDVDGLRALAVIVVVAYHMDPTWLPSGFVGVDIFFVISGFVVTQSLNQHIDEPATCFLTGFYERRLKRLMPASIMMTSCFAGVFAALLIPAGYQYFDMYFTSGRLALVGLSNMFFASQELGYFDHTGGGQDLNPFLHTWSLGVEEQFYLVAPLLLYYSRRLGTANTHTPVKASLATFAVATICSMAFSWWCSSQASSQLQAFYWLASRFWELACGVLLSEGQTLGGQQFTIFVSHYFVSGSLQFMAAILMALAIMFTPNDAGFPFPSAVPVVCGAVCFIAAGPDSFLNRCLSKPWIVLVGKASYSIYLFHWPVFVFFKWTMGLDSWDTRTNALLMVAGLSALSYMCIEKPTRRFRPNNQFVFFATIASSVMLGQFVLFELQLNAAFLSSFLAVEVPPQPSTLKGFLPLSAPGITCSSSRPSASLPCRKTIPTLYSSCNAQLDAEHLPECLPSFEGDIKSPEINQMGTPWESAMADYDCHIHGKADVNKTMEGIDQSKMASCLGIGAERTKPALFVIGDSHAEHFVEGFQKTLASRFLVKPFTYENQGYNKSSDVPLVRDYANKIDESLARELRSGDVLVHVRSEEPHYANGVDLPSLLNLANLASDHNATLLLLGNVVESKVEAVTCLVNSYWNRDAPLQCECTLKAWDDWNKPQHEAYKDLAMNFSNVVTYDPSYLFCDNMTCGPFIPGTRILAVWDFSHLTVRGSLYVAPFIADFMSMHGLQGREETEDTHATGALQTSVGDQGRRKRLRQSRGRTLFQQTTTCAIGSEDF